MDINQQKLTKELKLIAEFMGLIYIPWNNLQGYSAPGWWVNIDSFNNKDTKPGIIRFREEQCKNHLSKIGGRYYKGRQLLQYYSSWNRLMPVVEKIANYHELSLNDTLDFLNYEYDFEGLNNIKDIYNVIIKFIQWYNKQKL